MKKIASRQNKKNRPLKLRSVIKPTRQHRVRTKYSRKGKWAKRHGL